MSKNTRILEVRYFPPTREDFELYTSKFRPLCAKLGLSEAEVFSQLISKAIATDKDISSKTWVSYEELEIALAEHQIQVNRQLIYNHRLRGLLTGLYYQNKETQKIFFDLDGCINLYKEIQRLKKTAGVQ